MGVKYLIAAMTIIILTNMATLMDRNLEHTETTHHQIIYIVILVGTVI